MYNASIPALNSKSVAGSGSGSSAHASAHVTSEVSFSHRSNFYMQVLQDAYAVYSDPQRMRLQQLAGM